MNNYCLKWGTKYSADYVNHLAYQLGGNLICVTDDPLDVECETIPLPASDLQKWWNKMYFFNEELFPNPGMFYDLDVYIKEIPEPEFNENITLIYTDWNDLKLMRRDLMNFSHKFCSINSSIMCWDENTKRQQIFDYYIKYRDRIEYQYGGIDTFIEHRFPYSYNLFQGLSVSSFYKNGSDANIILFEGANQCS